MRRAANFHARRTGLPSAGLLAAGLALVLLAACTPATPEASPDTPAPVADQPAPVPVTEPTLDPTAPPPAPATGATAAAPVESHWQCGDQRVAARFDNDAQTVTVVHDRGEVVLPQAISASGARYADANGNEFWTKGASGTLTLSGAPARECSEVSSDG
jgi:membrane-bound inhibitor of C-type lysozyme